MCVKCFCLAPGKLDLILKEGTLLKIHLMGLKSHIKKVMGTL